jgi:hypothetical protein
MYRNSNRPRPGLSCRSVYVLLVFIVAIIWGIITWAVDLGKKALGIPTATIYIQDCNRWQNITLYMIGENTCVYGEVAYLSQDTQSEPTIIRLSPKADGFYLIDTESIYPDLTLGTCVKAKGTIEQYQGVLCMQIYSLNKCK